MLYSDFKYSISSRLTPVMAMHRTREGIQQKYIPGHIVKHSALGIELVIYKLGRTWHVLDKISGIAIANSEISMKRAMNNVVNIINNQFNGNPIRFKSFVKRERIKQYRYLLENGLISVDQCASMTRLATKEGK